MTATARAGYFGKTERLSVTDTPAQYEVMGPNESRRAFLVSADVNVHITRDGTTASPDTGLRIPADALVLVNCFAGDSIGYVKGDGEADGNLWISLVDH